MENECAWCGAEITGTSYKNRNGEVFCSKYHRRASNEALKELIDTDQNRLDIMEAIDNYTDFHMPDTIICNTQRGILYDKITEILESVRKRKQE